MRAKCLTEGIEYIITHPEKAEGQIDALIDQACKRPEFDHLRKSLKQTLTALSLDNLEVKSISPGQISVLKDGIEANIGILLDGQGYLQRLSINPDFKQVEFTIKNLDKISHQQGCNLSWELFDGKTVEKDKGPQLVPIYSLSKLFIIEGILSITDEKQLKENLWIVQCDTDSRSWGSSDYQVRNRFSKKELITRALLASDNSASNALLRLLKSVRTRESTGIKYTWEYLSPTQQEYQEKVWISDDIATQENAGNGVYPLSWVRNSLEKISAADWNPYMDLPEPLSKYIFKGGTSINSYSLAWCENGKAKPKSLILSLWGNRPIGFLEEIYLTQFGRRLFERISGIDLTLNNDALIR